MLNIIKAFLATVLAVSFCNLGTFAMTPEEYCQIHTDSGAPGSCTANGKCAVLTTNLGTEEYKLCSDGGCELVSDSSQCNE